LKEKKFQKILDFYIVSVSCVQKPGEQEGQNSKTANKVNYIEQTARALQQLALVIGNNRQ